MLGAIKLPNGKYAIKDRYDTPRFGTTYHKRERLRAMGGKWNGETRHWEGIDEQFLKDLHAYKLVKVKIKPYPGCDVESVISVYEDQIKNNQVQVLDWGDSRIWVDVVENLGE
jgi:hypothetical protein